MDNNRSTNKDNLEFYAINEVGDLGLGADVLNEQDQKTINEENKKNNK